MRTQHLIPDLMRSMRGVPGAKTGHVDQELDGRIERWQVGFPLKRLMQWHWFLEPYASGIEILSVSDIVQGEQESPQLATGYLRIGACPNGDRVYLKESDFSVSYWSHDEAKQWDRVEPQALHLVYPSVDLLLLAVVNASYIPCDSYSGREYAKIVNFRRDSGTDRGA